MAVSARQRLMAMGAPPAKVRIMAMTPPARPARR
jgi:hypothetical protein